MAGNNIIPGEAVPWLKKSGPENDVVLCSTVCLSRNINGFCFPPRCAESERGHIETAVLNAAEALPVFSGGTQYFSPAQLSALSHRRVRLLRERQLINDEVPRRGGGVLVASHQRAALMVNGEDHLCLVMFSSGLALETLWRELDKHDDLLATQLDFSFSSAWGYLTARPTNVGTGLRAMADLHLPGLTMIAGLAPLVKNHVESCLFARVYEQPTNEPGEFYRVANRRTAGRSEEELILELRHVVLEIAKREREARDELMKNERRQLEDRVARAESLVRGARLLEYDEAVALLSSLRLGAVLGLTSGPGPGTLDILLTSMQAAHVEESTGCGREQEALSAARAELLRQVLGF